MNFSQKPIMLLGLVLVITLISYYRHFNRDKTKNEKQTHQKISKTIFSFLGAPGCGKGTLAEQCVSQLGFKVVSTGNLCREEIAKGTDKGEEIAKYSQSARLVPDQIITEMLAAWLTKQDGKQPIILDGYPRTKEQAKMLAELLKTQLSDYQFRVISLEMDDLEKIVKRMSGRLVCENKKCQATTHRSLLKNQDELICEKCEGTLIQREDDKEKFVRNRLSDFMKNKQQIIAFYKKARIPMELINVSNMTPQEMFETFKQMISK